MIMATANIYECKFKVIFVRFACTTLMNLLIREGDGNNCLLCPIYTANIHSGSDITIQTFYIKSTKTIK